MPAMVPAADQVEHLRPVGEAQLFERLEGSWLRLAAGEDQIAGAR